MSLAEDPDMSMASPLPWTAAEDATMRNALAFLAQKDSEAALVYALVHDPEFRLATALTSSAQRVVDVRVVRALLQLFDAYEDQLRRFVALLMVREMVDTLNWNELFRANSATTAIIREYTCDLGLEFLQNAFQDVLAEVWDSTESYEVNPRLLKKGESLAANRARLEALATRLLDKVFDSAALFPYQVAKIYRVMEGEMTRLIDRDRKSNISLQRLSAISEDAALFDDRRSNSLPRLSSISEDMFSDDFFRGSFTSNSANSNGTGGSGSTGISAAKEEFYVHLGGFLFLRFLCPALLMPQKMGLTPNGKSPSKTLQRTLVLVAKLFQSLANNVDYGNREEYMEPFNGFLTQNRTKLFKFYDQICQQATNDNRRESLIMRSNLAPRISQLWTMTTNARGSTNAASTIYGLLGNQPLVESIEDALGVVQGWITEHLDSLVKEVATNGKAKRKVAPGVDLAAGAISPAKKKKASPKHKLKTSKTLSPLPTAAGEDEDEDEDDTSTQAETMRTIPDKIAAEELETVIGNTVHRDIQLMKIYYSKLSQTGLQRLLSINGEDSAHEWVLYRTRNNVEVFRREDPTTKTCALSFGPDRPDKFVEMKSHVEINATPRKVYEYLKSLEKITEWDHRITQVRRVEPLDDSKVVMYRSHPKLSLWPTWLVKPRDSCDLHSFVDRTGRPDTYCVLMESVPRPDVPTIKGTVRMSFATGGFLVEPGPITAEHGQTTKLTCVVNADFKGSLPRYLAESICFRQVLSVRSIKLRLESSMQHRNSSWV